MENNNLLNLAYRNNQDYVLEPIESHKDLSKLEAELYILNRTFAGKYVRHVKSMGIYEIYGAEIGNREGKSFYDFKYFKLELNGDVYRRVPVPFNRPIAEFLDGRYELIY